MTENLRKATIDLELLVMETQLQASSNFARVHLDRVRNLIIHIKDLLDEAESAEMEHTCRSTKG